MSLVKRSEKRACLHHFFKVNMWHLYNKVYSSLTVTQRVNNRHKMKEISKTKKISRSRSKKKYMVWRKI